MVVTNGLHSQMPVYGNMTAFIMENRLVKEVANLISNLYMKQVAIFSTNTLNVTSV